MDKGFFPTFSGLQIFKNNNNNNDDDDNNDIKIPIQ